MKKAEFLPCAFCTLRQNVMQILPKFAIGIERGKGLVYNGFRGKLKKDYL